jgi:hypothetical protein
MNRVARIACPLLVAGGIVALSSAVALADHVQIIYTKIVGHPSSVVPGARDNNGNPIVVPFRQHGDLVGSPAGSQWLLWGSTHPDTSLGHRFIILGEGKVGDIIAQENLQVPDSTAGIIYDFFPSGVGRFNDANDYVFTARAKNTPINFQQRVMISLSGVIGEYARESDLYTGLLDQFNQPAPNAAIGNSIGSVHLLNDGTVGAQDSTIKAAPGSSTNLHSSRRPAIFYNLDSFKQNGVHTVTNLDGDGSVLLTGSTALAANTFFTTPDSTPLSRGTEGTWIVRGMIDAPSGQQHAIIVNDKVAIQQGHPIPGSGVIPLSTSASTNPFFAHELAGNGDWYVRGAHNAGASRWAARNGAVFAVDGDPSPAPAAPKTGSPLPTSPATATATGFSSA